ncbi:MAG TPA: hypothetical protein VGK50_03035 [Coriobacteriia bacterium]|jgi:NRPS condensation-like uncharacterized protein
METAAERIEAGTPADVPAVFAATGTDLACAVTRAVTHHRIGLHLRFECRLDADRLARAVRLSLDADPVLGCRFAPEAGKGLWQRLRDLDGCRAFSTFETEDAERDSVAFQAEEVPDEGPQVAVALFRTGSHDELGLKISHVVADGQAMKQYAYLLAHLYTVLGADPSYRPEPNLLPRPTEADVWGMLTPEQRKAAKRAASWAPANWPVTARGSCGEGLTYRALTVEPERFHHLKAYGKERGSSVNDVLLAAYFRALVERLDPPRHVALTLMNTADHRRYLESPRRLPIANVSISGSVGVERVDGEDLGDTLRRIRERTAEWARTCYGVAPAVTAEKLARLGYRNMRRLMMPLLRLGARGKTMPFLTNIGVIEDERLVFADAAPAEAVMFGPSARGPSLVATVSTYRGRLSVVMGFCEADLEPEVIGGVLAAFEAELPG